MFISDLAVHFLKAIRHIIFIFSLQDRIYTVIPFNVSLDSGRLGINS